MKKRYAKIVVPVLMGVLCAAPVAFAGGGGGHHHDKSWDKNYDENVSVTLTDEVDTNLTRVNKNKTKISIVGKVGVGGYVPVASAVSALVDNKQVSHDNLVINYLHTNEAGTSNNVLGGATGNIGLNMTAGDNNLQDNAAALAAADSENVFDAADATVVVNQDAVRNGVCNHGTTNEAGMGGNSLTGAIGNIGVNISAGNSNLQKNNLAATAASAGVGTAAVAVMQQTGKNMTGNMGHYDEMTSTVTVDLDADLTQPAPASITGQADQYGDIYPDIWDSPLHPDGTEQTHFDLDNQLQAQLPDGTPLSADDIDPNRDGGAQLFNIREGELNDLALEGTVGGTITFLEKVAAPTTNTASLSGNVLQNARGNIGVNIAAGTNNLQSNSLAMITNTLVPEPIPTPPE